MEEQENMLRVFETELKIVFCVILIKNSQNKPNILIHNEDQLEFISLFFF